MGNSKPDKRYRPAIGCDHGGENPGGQKQQVSHSVHTHSKVAGIIVAKQYDIQRFGHKKGNQKPKNGDYSKNRKLLKRNT